jgi:hypothetical protein
MILLDCSFAEAFAGTHRETGGHCSLAVLASTREIEHIIVKSAAADRAKTSFTQKLVQGLVSGDADADEDGKISLEEVLQYVSTMLNAAQSPQKLTLFRYGSEEYEMCIGYAPKPKTEMLKHNQIVTSSKRLALLIASAEYQDPELRKLCAPPHDARALEVLLAAGNTTSYFRLANFSDWQTRFFLRLWARPRRCATSFSALYTNAHCPFLLVRASGGLALVLKRAGVFDAVVSVLKSWIGHGERRREKRKVVVKRPDGTVMEFDRYNLKEIGRFGG